jgi:UDP-N-acetylmuramoylalanine--D-glutamate ligase
VLFNAANAELAQRITASPARRISWPDERGARLSGDAIYYGTEHIIELTDIPLLGRHNVENCLGAITAAKYFQVPNAEITKAIKSFSPLRHRLQPVGVFHDISFYDDAISTTPESTTAALHVFNNIGCLFLGGQDRGYHFAQLAREIAKRKIPTLIFFPDTGVSIRAELEKIGYTPEHTLETRSMEEAVRFAYAHTPRHSVCLLSCASPSYSVFKNFEDKGDQFQHWVQQLA